MDATREHLLGRIVLERRIVLEDELRRLLGERDDLMRRGNASVSLGQLLVRDRRLDVAQLIGLQNEIEVRGRACFACRRAYLVAAGGPATCPACGGSALLPAAGGAPPRPASTPPPSYPATPAPGYMDDYSPSGRFVNSQASAVARANANVNSSGVVRSGGPPSGVARPGPTSSARMRAAAATHAGDGSAHAPAWQQAAVGSLPSTDPGSKSSSKGSGGAQGSGPAAAAARSANDLGKTLGPYELEKELGRGGMGVVYRARHSRTGETVALKVLLSAEFASAKMVARFQDEAKLVQKLEHPNIVPVLDIGQAGETQYFTMKFIEGELFSDMIKGRGLSARRGAEILRDVARGAHHAHENGIIHRDLKPANIIVERASGRPYLMDFGLAKDLEDDKHLSKTGVAIGTPYYMPPEQALGKHREIDSRTDVYALGAMLYEVLAKKIPFNAETQAALLRKIVEDEPVPPSQVKQGVPPDLETIALKAIRKSKAERYPSADAFAADIERALKGKEIKAQREAAWAPLVRTLRKNPKIAGSIAVATVIAGGGIAFGAYAINKAASVQKKIEDEKAEQEARKKAEEEQKAKEEAAAKRKTDLEELLSKGRQGRLSARTALSAEEARRLLGRAIRDLSDALNLAEDGTEQKAQAFYERGLARVELGTRPAAQGALEDFEQASAGKNFRARAVLLSGIQVLRREHDAARAQKKLEDARQNGEGGGSTTDDRARLEEQAAAALAQGYLKFLSGDLTAAIARCREAERSDLHAFAADALAFMNLSASPANAQAALDAASRGLAQDRWSYALICDRGWARALTGDLALARADSKTAKDICPDAREVYLVDAWIAALSGNDDDMRAALSEARRDTSQAREYWSQVEARLNAKSEVLRERPPLPDPNAPPIAGRKLWDDLVIDKFISPKATPLVPEINALFPQGKLAEALALVSKREQEFPDDAGFKYWHARMFIENGRAPEALPVLERILAKTPDDAFALTLLGQAEMLTGALEKARTALEKALEKDSKLRTPRMLLVTVLSAMKKSDEGVALLRAMFDADNADGDVVNTLTTAYVSLKRLPDAEEVVKKALVAAPSSFQIRTSYMTVLRNMGRIDELMRFADEGERAAPTSWARLLEKATALAYASRWNESQDYVKRARDAAPADAERLTVDNLAVQLRNLPH